MSTARKMRRKLNRALPGADVETVPKSLKAESERKECEEAKK